MKIFASLLAAGSFDFPTSLELGSPSLDRGVAFRHDRRADSRIRNLHRASCKIP
jgi:hypothetical protein